MFIKKITCLLYPALCLLFAGCVGPTPQYGPVGDAAELDAPMYGTFEEKTVAVILPDSALGKSVRTAIEMAFIQKRPENMTVRFTDLSGGKESRASTMENALSQNPDMIIGPIFAEDVKALRDIKPSRTPVLSFTSDTTALGDGVMTMSLLPGQSAETIVRYMPTDNRKEMMILAPDNASGYIMSNAALDAAYIYGVRVSGLYYYTPSDMDSMKNAAENAAMWNARGDANTRAKEILSDILIKKEISAAEKASISAQLEDRNKSDTIGNLPYDAVLFLGNASDSKALGSFLRYYDVRARQVKFYGTAMWDNESMWRDMTFSGAHYAALPPVSMSFANTYREIMNAEPDRISPMGYDAAMLAMRALSSDLDEESFLIDPSGFRGLDGLIKLEPSGTSKRALQVMTLDASGAPKMKMAAATNFIKPLYQVTGQNGSKPSEIKPSIGINPLDYIKLPAHLQGRYSAKTYRQNGNSYQPKTNSLEEIIILPEDSSDPVIDSEFQPIELETVTRTLVDEVTY